MNERPLGIMILALVSIISGVFLMFTAVATPLLINAIVALFVGSVASELFMLLQSALFVVFSVTGLFLLFTAWGLWRGFSWAWYLAFFLWIIHLIFSVLTFSVFGVIGNIGVLLYLLNRSVQRWFNVNAFWSWDWR